ncbi:MAG: ferritin [Methanobacteriaceae archaeon]
MLNSNMERALNAQVNAELYSSYLYLAMAAYFEDSDLSGFANWMKIQAQEELSHGMKIYEFIISRGGRVELDLIEKPQVAWESPIHAFENVYSHEQKVTGLINNLVDLAIVEKDHATNNFLQWFVAEQVEEEETASGILNKVKLAIESPSGLYLLDNDLASRVFNSPAE